MKYSLLLLSAMLLYGCIACDAIDKYDIKIIFCDGRHPVTATVSSMEAPSANDIRTGRDYSVPQYSTGCGCGNDSGQKYLNVCDIQVLRKHPEKKKKSNDDE